MKNKLLATIAAFGLVGSASAVEINDNLSINGFIDGSYQYSDADLGTTSRRCCCCCCNTPKDQALGVDEVELTSSPMLVMLTVLSILTATTVLR